MFVRQISTLALLALAALPAAAAFAATDELWSLYRQKDYFSLRTKLPPPRADDTPDLAFLHAAEDAAFGRSQAAIGELQNLLRRSPSVDLRAKADRLLMSEQRARYHYRSALAAIEPLVAGLAAESVDQTDMSNSAMLVSALADVRPQATEQRGAREVESDRSGRFAVTINGRASRLGFDTGADFSFLSASAAKLAGLEVRTVGLAVASSTGTDAHADVAVGDVAIAGALIRNVVFLVLPDASLTLPDGLVINGLLGTPVLSALGAVTFDKGGRISWTDATPPGSPNLAMEENEVLLPVGYEGQTLLCRLDTGAQNTVFHEPFYRRYPRLFVDASRRQPLRLGGVSGAHEIPAYRLEAIDVTLTGQPVHLAGVSVMTRPITTPEENYSYCTIGVDALSGFHAYTIDLRHMSLSLHH